MAVEVYVPKMSDHMEEAVFLEWLVKEGDHVDSGQPILSVETDKVDAEIEAPASGFLKGFRPGLSEGVVLPVGETIAFIVSDPSVDVPDLPEMGSASPQSTPAEPAPAPTPPTSPTSAPAPENRGAEGPKATPSGRRLARELGIELSHITGTGPEGLISEIDVRRHSESS